MALDPNRFWSKVDKVTDDCWRWTACISNKGYGVYRLAAQTRAPAHRIAYAYWRGHIPEGLTLDHLCRNRACVNPWHLEPVTQAENNRRARIHKARWKVNP